MRASQKELVIFIDYLSWLFTEPALEAIKIISVPDELNHPEVSCHGNVQFWVI
jgi:hypothetical protein